jgi:hypothetical protein
MAVPRDGIIRVGVQLPLPPSPVLLGGEPPPTPTATLKRVRRLGLYSVPIDWRLDRIASVELGPTNQSMKVETIGRVRISAWAKPNDFWVESKGDSKKFERGRWAALDDGWGFDDVTFTQTVRLVDPDSALPAGMPTTDGKPDPDAVWWASNFLPSLQQSDKALTDWMRDAIQFFHAHKIQVFAGYEIVTQDWTKLEKPSDAIVNALKRDRNVGNAFVKWLNAKGSSMSDFEAHAKKLVDFFDSRGLDIDGISYDLEIDDKNKGHGLGRRHAPGIEALYLAVMRELAPKERYLAFAAAPVPDATYMHEQPYRLGNMINIIVRTMSYKVPGATGYGAKAPTGQGRERVVLDSLQQVSLHPSHLQIGLTTRDGQPGPISVDEAVKECETYRSLRVGLVHWYLEVNKKGPDRDYDLGQYQKYDRALNTPAPPRGTLGQPLQGPLGPQRLKAFADAREAEDKERAAAPAR